jgi:hypothetical protein
MDRLSQELLAKILALRGGQAQGTWNADLERFEQAGSSPTFYGSDDLSGYNVNDTGIAFDTGDDFTNNYELDGSFRDRTANNTGNANLARLAKMAAAAAAMYGGANLLSGSGLLGGGSAGELAAPAFGADGGAGFFGSALTNPIAAESIAAAGAMPGFTTAGLGAGAGLTAAEMAALYGGPGGGTMGSGLLSGAGSAGSALGSAASGVANALTGSNVLGGLAGAALGAASSKDQEQSTSRDPWKPAQPFLESLLNQGSALSQKYMDQPFSPQQQTAYNNFGGLLNTINQNAGGLLAGFGANASGANQYSRGRGPLTGSSFDMAGFKPGALSFFGG